MKYNCRIQYSKDYEYNGEIGDFFTIDALNEDLFSKRDPKAWKEIVFFFPYNKNITEIDERLRNNLKELYETIH